MLTLWMHRIVGWLGSGAYEMLSMISPLVNWSFAISYYWTQVLAPIDVAPRETLTRGIMGRTFRFIRGW